MRITQSSLSALGLILMLGVFIVIVYQVNSTPSNQSPSDQGKKDATGSSQTHANLWFATTEDKGTVVKIYNILNKQTEVKFTIQPPSILPTLLGFGSSGDILGLQAGPDDFMGTIASISNSGQVNVVGESFTFASRPVLSPDGQKVLYMTFSNDERDFGFKVKERNIITGTISTHATSELAIGLPRYCFEDEICYIEQQKSEFLIVKQSLDGKASVMQYQSGLPIVEWTALNDWLLTVEKTTKNDYRIVSVEQNQPKIIGTFPQYVKQIIPVRIDDKLAVAIVKINQQSDTAGELILFDIDSKTSTTIGKNVSFVVGWKKV